MKPATPKPAELPDHYYLDNFKYLVNFVFRHYEPLLNKEETEFYNGFCQLAENSQRLYIRLLSRSGEYARASKLSYREITNIDQALETLIHAGFISPASLEHLLQWVSLFTKKELASVLAAPPTDHETAAVLLLQNDLFGTSPLDTLLTSEQVFQVHHQHCFITFRLLFFGNLHQDLSAFVLRDMGLRKFESYLTDTTSLPFYCRDQIDATLCYYQCTSDYEAAHTEGAPALIALHELLPKDRSIDKKLNRRVDKFSNQIARQLERENELQQAAAIYRASEQPPARERLARIAATTDDITQALTICRQIEESPADAQEFEFAQEFSVRLAAKAGIEHTPITKVKPEEIVLQLPQTRLPVEFAAALHFAKYGKCFYVENNLITGIFGLAIWDILFAAIPGAFYHPFQSSPADIYDADFFEQRKVLFEQRFADLHAGQLKKIVLTHFHTKYGINNRFVHWPFLSRYLIDLALKRIPTEHWINMFDHLLADIRNHKSGLPDLIFFPDSGSYQLLEVKGPGDKLQKNQLRWMRQFSHCNIAHAVVHVEYTGRLNNTAIVDNGMVDNGMPGEHSLTL